MLSRFLTPLPGALLLLLSACGAGSYTSVSGVMPSSSTTADTVMPTIATGFTAGSSSQGTDNLVTATPSTGGTVSVVVGARRRLSIAFTSTDGQTITGFGISGSLGALPAGWSGPGSFACESLGGGSGCVLNLTYAPQALDSGTFTLDYVFVDNATVPRTNYSVTIAYAATPSNNVTAAASPTGQVNAVIGDAAPVSINFTTDDGNAATNLALTTDVNALPQGWSVAAPGFSCAIVSTGNGCQLALVYKPSAAARGTLVLTYGYTDFAGLAKTGTLNIPYSTASVGSVVATTSPTGQILAVQKTGGQAVAVTFDTNDGSAATQLSVTSSLTALPAGWTAASESFTCASVSTGNGCQLRLNYAPPALDSGTLSLAYAYTDSAGARQNGVIDLDYAATTDDNVAATASPSGQIAAVVGAGTQAVAVSFTTDDKLPATALQLTSALSMLPAGWSASVNTFACAGLNSGAGCQLNLAYTPAAADSGTLTLGFSYRNDAGAARTGSLGIPYRATTNDNVVGTPSQSALLVRTGSSTPVTVDFTTDDGNPASALSVTAGLDPLPAGWSSAAGGFSCQTISSGTACSLALEFAPIVPGAGTLNLAYTYANDSGSLKSGNVSISYTAADPYLLVVDSTTSSVSSCAINLDGTLVACTPTGTGFAAPAGLALSTSFAYVSNGTFVAKCRLVAPGLLGSCAPTGPAFAAAGNIAVNALATFAYVEQTGGISVCAIAAADGSLSGCIAAGPVATPLSGVTLAPDGLHAYGVDALTTALEVCLVATDGTLTGCVDAGGGLAQAVSTVALLNGNLYAVSSAGVLNVCAVQGDGTLAGCRNTAAGVSVAGVAFSGSVAYLSNPSTGVTSCAVSTDGTLANCAALADPTFSGTRGVAIR